MGSNLVQQIVFMSWFFLSSYSFLAQRINWLKNCQLSKITYRVLEKDFTLLFYFICVYGIFSRLTKMFIFFFYLEKFKVNFSYNLSQSLTHLDQAISILVFLKNKEKNCGLLFCLKFINQGNYTVNTKEIYNSGPD